LKVNIFYTKLNYNLRRLSSPLIGLKTHSVVETRLNNLESCLLVTA